MIILRQKTYSKEYYMSYDKPLGHFRKHQDKYLIGGGSLVGAGIGYSWMKETLKLADYGFPNESIKDKDWGWNVGLGVGYALTEKVDLTLGYRYENLGKIKDYDSENKLTNHKVSFGVRYTF